MRAAEYRDKWEVESWRAMAKAVLAGEGIAAAAERIHRRFHRAVSVLELTQSGLFHARFTAETAKRQEREDAKNALVSRLIDNVTSAATGRYQCGGPSREEGIARQSVIGEPRGGGGSGVPAPSPDISHRGSGQTYKPFDPSDELRIGRGDQP